MWPALITSLSIAHYLLPHMLESAVLVEIFAILGNLILSLSDISGTLTLKLRQVRSDGNQNSVDY